MGRKIRKMERVADVTGIIGTLGFMMSMVTYGFGLETLYHIMTIVWIVGFSITSVIYLITAYMRLCIDRHKQRLAYRRRKEEEAR